MRLRFGKAGPYQPGKRRHGRGRKRFAIAEAKARKEAENGRAQEALQGRVTQFRPRRRKEQGKNLPRCRARYGSRNHPPQKEKELYLLIGAWLNLGRGFYYSTAPG